MSGNLTQIAIREALRMSCRQAHEVAFASDFSDGNMGFSKRKRDGFYQYNGHSRFDLKAFTSTDNLIIGFNWLKSYGGQAPGIDGIRFEDFSTVELFSGLRGMEKAIRNRQYTPSPTKLELIPKGDGRFRELRIQTVMDRVVAKSLHLCLRLFWKSRLPDFGQGIWSIYREMHRHIIATRNFILTTEDVRDAFPSAPIDQVMNFHRRHIDDQDLIWLIGVVIRGHEGTNRERSLDQGNPYSPVAMELLLKTVLDQEIGRSNQDAPFLIRYADNIALLTRDGTEGSRQLNFVQETLRPHGMSLKGNEGIPTDLRDPEGRAKLLGLEVSWSNGEITLGLPENAYENLADGLTKALEASNPDRMAEAVLRGWLEATGPTLEPTAIDRCLGRISSLLACMGLREVKLPILVETARKAHAKWQAYLHQPLDQSTRGVTGGVGEIPTEVGAAAHTWGTVNFDQAPF